MVDTPATITCGAGPADNEPSPTTLDLPKMTLDSVTAHNAATLGPQFLRFAVLGALKTIATGVLFYFLAAVLPTTLAFTFVYVLGLLVVALVTPRFVFQITARRLMVGFLLLWYVVVYFVGLAVVGLLDAVTDSRLLLTLGTICVTAPLGFAGARLLLWHSRPSGAPREPC